MPCSFSARVIAGHTSRRYFSVEDRPPSFAAARDANFTLTAQTGCSSCPAATVGRVLQHYYMPGHDMTPWLQSPASG